MGGLGGPSYQRQTERPERESRDREPIDAVEGKLPRAANNAIAFLSSQNLERLAPLLDRDKLIDHCTVLEEIADKFDQIELALSGLLIDVSFNGGLLKILPEIQRWQNGFKEELALVEKLLKSLSVKK